MGVSRREFLQIAAAGAGGWLIAQSPLGRLVPLIKAEKIGLPGQKEKFVTTSCLLCPENCGIMARVVDERLVSVKGNPLHPVTRGGICPKGLSSPHILYHPDRIKGPLKRIGKDKWQPITWDRAIQEIAEILKSLKKKGDSHKVLFYNGRPYGLTDLLFGKFCENYGTPNYIREIIPDPIKDVIYFFHGINSFPAYDFERTRLILSFGADLLDDFPAFVGFAKKYGNFRQGRERERGKLIQISPRLSTTSAKADEWIEIKPKTYGALAQALVYIIIRESLFDKRFIDEHTQGFSEWKDYILKETDLDEISKETGVLVTTMYKIALEFGQTQPAIALSDWKLSFEKNGIFDAGLIYSLNILTGNIENKGGIHFPYPLPHTEFAGGSEAQRKEIKSPSILPELIESQKPEVLFLYYANPLYKFPNSSEIEKKLSKVKNIVSFSPFMDETTRELAHLILPDSTFLERWQDAPYPFYETKRVISIVKPVVSPLFDTRTTQDVILSIDKKISNQFLYNRFEEFLEKFIEFLWTRKGGGPFTDVFSARELERMQESGFWIQGYKNKKSFISDIKEKGGWFDPAYIRGEFSRIFKTESGKFEFSSRILEKLLKEKKEIVEKFWETKIDTLIMPRYIPKKSTEDEINLLLYSPLTVSYGTNARLPFLQEIMGYHLWVMWDSWCEISRDLAKKLGIKDKEKIKISINGKSLELTAKISPKIEENTIAIPLGFGHRTGKFAKGIGTNPLALIPHKTNPLTGNFILDHSPVELLIKEKV